MLRLLRISHMYWYTHKVRHTKSLVRTQEKNNLIKAELKHTSYLVKCILALTCSCWSFSSNVWSWITLASASAYPSHAPLALSHSSVCHVSVDDAFHDAVHSIMEKFTIGVMCQESLKSTSQGLSSARLTQRLPCRRPSLTNVYICQYCLHPSDWYLPKILRVIDEFWVWLLHRRNTALLPLNQDYIGLRVLHPEMSVRLTHKHTTITITQTTSHSQGHKSEGRLV
jgi:hypothetical protein